MPPVKCGEANLNLRLQFSYNLINRLNFN